MRLLGVIVGCVALSGAAEGLRAAETSGGVQVVPDLEIELVRIPAGRFVMGSEEGEDGDEKPLTRVTLTDDFWIGRYEVTQRAWRILMDGTPSHFQGDERRPVEQVSWLDAVEFCRRLTRREAEAGRLPEGMEFRLPTEAEWEYAARAGIATDYVGELPEVGWYKENSGGTPHPVGEKAPNAWGLYDVHGNVWEWCLDWYGPYPGGEVTNPSGPDNGEERIFRGGSWRSGPVPCGLRNRNGAEPDERQWHVGFRIVLAPAREATR